MIYCIKNKRYIAHCKQRRTFSLYFKNLFGTIKESGMTRVKNRWGDSFITESEFRAIFFIKGHRFVMEADIYNRQAYVRGAIHQRDDM